MPRKTFPRPENHHRLAAQDVLQRHVLKTGVPVVLPVPIELIIQVTYELTVLWDQIVEPPETMILGALIPDQRRIVLNERHTDTFERWVGPERFTLAHELAHWLYDADDPNQMSLDLSQSPAERYCYHRESSRLAEDLRIREINANKLAAHLLLPEHLVRQADLESVFGDFRGTAARWGVSQQTLQIRLDSLGLTGPGPGRRLGM